MPDTALLCPRWDGRPGRIDTWYATLTDPVTGDGFWIHADLWASTGTRVEVHGWAAVFPVDGEPEVERFGPVAVTRLEGDGFDGAGVRFGPDVLVGRAGRIAWDLRWFDPGTPPLFTFPRWWWGDERLPGGQVVPAPTATFAGTVALGGRRFVLDAARGAVARVYRHRQAGQWAWLHADLGDGDVLEVVAAQAHRGAFRALGVLPFVQLRIGGETWPREPFLAALQGQADVRLPSFTVELTAGARRLAIEVDVPSERAVALEVHDPDGATATCTNSERADARILLEHRTAEGWVEERRWTLEGTAHAEVGLRP